MFGFALRAKALLATKVPCLSAPILRVDIFQRQTGQLVVNEFESLEAMIDASGQRSQGLPRVDPNTDDNVRMFKQIFWEDKIKELLETVRTTKYLYVA